MWSLFGLGWHLPQIGWPSLTFRRAVHVLTQRGGSGRSIKSSEIRWDHKRASTSFKWQSIHRKLGVHRALNSSELLANELRRWRTNQEQHRFFVSVYIGRIATWQRVLCNGNISEWEHWGYWILIFCVDFVNWTMFFIIVIFTKNSLPNVNKSVVLPGCLKWLTTCCFVFNTKTYF